MAYRGAHQRRWRCTLHGREDLNSADILLGFLVEALLALMLLAAAVVY